MMPISHRRAYLILMLGLFAGSLSAIFTRLAEREGMPALAIAAGRLSLGALALMPFALRHYDIYRTGDSNPNRREHCFRLFPL
jgi:hypothetical protein